jgi:release factor glutamine methyltransferase
MAITIDDILTLISQGLTQTSETPFLDAQVLVAHFLEKPRAWVLAHPEAGLYPLQQKTITMAVERLQQGVPLPYIIGHWEFYGIDFQLTPDVLIPRPETELLVERALLWLRDHPGAHRIVDVGTGSGCIGISMAVNNPAIDLLMTDASPEALQVARINAEKFGLTPRLEFQQADLLEGVMGSFDLICANLPYIPSRVLKSLPVSEREPLLALDGGQDGLELITRLLDQSRDHLSPGGLLLLEIESTQGKEATSIARNLYPASKVQVLKDLSGIDRCVEIMFSNLIVHLCPQSEWLEARERDEFTDDSLVQDGFIHCSRPDQVLQVANHYYRGIPGLTVLWIDPEKITAEIRWEPANGNTFPHIYGPIDLAAVTAVTDLRPDVDSYYRQIDPPC